MPDIPGIALAISSDEMFDLPALPERIVIVGGGYIACEFACIMQGLGSKVTQLYRRDLPLRGFDHDLREVLCEEMRKGGGRPPPQHKRGLPRAQRVGGRRHDHNRRDHRGGPGAVCHRAQAQRRPISGSRQPASSPADGGAIPVDEASHTGAANIYAIGDVH